MVINLIRVSYGRDDTLANLREYKIEGTGPVGTIGEFKNNFPNTKFNVIDKRINKIEEVEDHEKCHSIVSENYKHFCIEKNVDEFNYYCKNSELMVKIFEGDE